MVGVLLAAVLALMLAVSVWHGDDNGKSDRFGDCNCWIYFPVQR